MVVFKSKELHHIGYLSCTSHCTQNFNIAIPRHRTYRTASSQKKKRKTSAHSHDQTIRPGSQTTPLNVTTIFTEHFRCTYSCLARHTFCVRKVPMVASPLPRLRILACQRSTPPLCEPAHVTPMYLEESRGHGVRGGTDCWTAARGERANMRTTVHPFPNKLRSSAVIVIAADGPLPVLIKRKTTLCRPRVQFDGISEKQKKCYVHARWPGIEVHRRGGEKY